MASHAGYNSSTDQDAALVNMQRSKIDEETGYTLQVMASSLDAKCPTWSGVPSTFLLTQWPSLNKPQISLSTAVA